jgi:hypothetical protein
VERPSDVGFRDKGDCAELVMAYYLDDEAGLLTSHLEVSSGAE